MLDGELKTVVDADKPGIGLLADATAFLRGKPTCPRCTIAARRASPPLEGWKGWARWKAWMGSWPNGRDGFDSIAASFRGSRLRLLQCTPFSNGGEACVSRQERRAVENGQLKDGERREQVRQHLRAGTARNLRGTPPQRTRQIAGHARGANPEAAVAGTYGRGLGGAALFGHEAGLGNLFARRARPNRGSNGTALDKSGRGHLAELARQQFLQGEGVRHQRMRFKKRALQQARGAFEWNSAHANGQLYPVVRTRSCSRSGGAVFKGPMPLLTGMGADSLQTAQLAFDLRVRRAKIEAVLKFRKDALGRGRPRLDDFEAMESPSCPVYPTAGYFHETDGCLVQNRTAQWLAQMGGGKGRATQHFVLEGIECPARYQQMQQFVKEHQLSGGQTNQGPALFSLTSKNL